MTQIFTPPRICITDLEDLCGTRDLGFQQGFFGGSRVICDPPPTDTDRDFVLLVNDVATAACRLYRHGWQDPAGMSEYRGEHGDFVTVRRGEDNAMLFGNPVEFGAVLAATCIATQKNIMQKSERYALFETARATWRR